MIDVDYITMNGIDYLVFDRLSYKNNDYIYLVNENDELDFYIRKVIKKDNSEFLINVETPEEFTELLEQFALKQQK